MKSRFFYIILVIVLLIIVSPFISSSGKTGKLLTTIFLALIPLTSFFALITDKKRAIIILFLLAPFVILDGMNLFFTNRYLMMAVHGYGTIVYFYIIVLLLNNLLSYQMVTADMIYCAIATYFLIGTMWSGIYHILEGISPGSFSGISGTVDLIYFSFVCLTTLGFGDITPQSIIGKRFAIFEAAMGVIYLSVIIAIIVGRDMLQKENHDSESEKP
jgi:hypothetical protein